MRVWLTALMVALSALTNGGGLEPGVGRDAHVPPDGRAGVRGGVSTGGPSEITRPRGADFYREDIRVRHEPALIEPFPVASKSGPIKKIGLFGWTAPPGREPAIVQHEINGWFAFGNSLIWE